MFGISNLISVAPEQISQGRLEAIKFNPVVMRSGLESSLEESRNYRGLFHFGWVETL